MPTDVLSWLMWLLLAAVALAALLWWWRGRQPPQAQSDEGPGEPPPTPPAPVKPWGREYKVAVGSAGIKSIVRERRIEDAASMWPAGVSGRWPAPAADPLLEVPAKAGPGGQ